MPLTTPDGRYIVVKGRLWRAANPSLSEAERTRLVADLMNARRAVRAAKDDAAAMRSVRNTPYAAWFATTGDGEAG